MAELAQGGSPAYYPLEDDFAAYRLTGKEAVNHADTDRLLREVLGQKSATQHTNLLANSLKRRVNTHYKRVLKKRKRFKKNCPLEAEQAEQWRLRGELLTANFHLLQPGLQEIEVVDYTRAEQPPLLKIELDPLLGPAANVQRIFKRYQKSQGQPKNIPRGT